MTNTGIFQSTKQESGTEIILSGVVFIHTTYVNTKIVQIVIEIYIYSVSFSF